MRHGVRLAVDPGGRRIGVARSDPAGLLATPVETLHRGQGDIAALAAMAKREDAVEVIVGLPSSLSGADGPAARRAREYAAVLARRLAPIPVRLVDERLTTVTAQGRLKESAGRSGHGRQAGRRRREVVDQAAATVLLQGALDTERGTGHPPGEPVEARGPHGDT